MDRTIISGNTIIDSDGQHGIRLSGGASSGMSIRDLLDLVAKARKDGIYEEDPDWDPIDAELRRRGYDVSQD